MDLQKTHPIVQTDSFLTVETYVLHLMHRKAYEYAAELASGKRLLDWGCNDGYGMELMRPFVAQLAGLDTAEHCVLAARRRMPTLGSNISLYDGNKLPYPPESFDVVTSFQVIEHVRDTEIYLSHILDALAPDGMAVITTPNKNLRLGPNDEPWNHYHFTEFSATELEKLLARRFSRVQILGLRGTAEIEMIERNRCRFGRQASRRSQSYYWRFRGAAFKQARRILPDVMERKLRTFMRSGSTCKDFLARFTTKDLHYSSACIDGALDLMAICIK